MELSRSIPIVRRANDVVLLTSQLSIYLGLACLFAVFSSSGPLLQALELWVGIMLAGRIETIQHWSVHSPVFRSRVLNMLHRFSFAIVPSPWVWYRAIHLQHHRYDNGPQDLTTTLEPDNPRRHQALPRYLFWSILRPHYLDIYRKLGPAQRRDFLISAGLTLGLIGALASIDPGATLAFWLPVTWIGYPMIVALYNYTDHVPGRVDDPYRLATYKPLASKYQKLLSLIDLHNISTHLAHHRHPGVYWGDLPTLQERDMPSYIEHASPTSLALNSGILMNPIAMILMAIRAHQCR